jgi:hypothetical protein
MPIGDAIGNAIDNPHSPINGQSPIRQSSIGIRQSVNRQAAVGNRK